MGGDVGVARGFTTGRVDQYGQVPNPTAQGIEIFAGTPSRHIDSYDGINDIYSPVNGLQLRPGEGINKTNY